jgi:hypothetical protein
LETLGSAELLVDVVWTLLQNEVYVVVVTITVLVIMPTEQPDGAWALEVLEVLDALEVLDVLELDVLVNVLVVAVVAVVVVEPVAGTLVALAGTDDREGVALQVDTLRP